jgi:hypothetical protein
MSAGVANFIIEQGADWAVQIYWQSEQTGQSIQAQGPMDMDIVNPLTGQRLIRLDDGSNGGIETGGAPYGIIQLEIDRNTTTAFAVGSYVYDLYVYSVGPPLQRVRLLSGACSVAAAVTALGVQLGQIVNAGVLPPDIIMDTTEATGVVTFTFDADDPTNQNDNLENGVPFRAGLTGVGNYPAADSVVYASSHGNGPLRDAQGAAITGAQVNNWLSYGAVVTVTYNGQTYGLTVSKVEYAPGGTPSPPSLLVASTDTGGE